MILTARKKIQIIKTINSFKEPISVVLLARFLGVDWHSLLDGLLNDEDFIFAVNRRNGNVIVTGRGRQWFADEINNMREFHAGEREWKDQALLGITATGRRSKIEKAALAKDQREDTHKDIADLIERSRDARARLVVCRSCGYTVDIGDLVKGKKICLDCHRERVAASRAKKEREGR
jgi:predicted Zn-ribbon and HTH transcriptional regulator